MGIVRIVGAAAAAGMAASAVRRRVDGVRQVRRSVAEYREHWRALAEGHDPDGQELRYVALGDSAAQAVGASSPEAGYVAAVAQHLAGLTGRDVALFNLSVSGAKATDVLGDQLPRLADLGFTPDVLTLGIGGNDIVDRRISVQAFLDTMTEVLAKLPPGSFVADSAGLPDPAVRGPLRRDGPRGAAPHPRGRPPPRGAPPGDPVGRAPRLGAQRGSRRVPPERPWLRGLGGRVHRGTGCRRHVRE